MVRCIDCVKLEKCAKTSRKPQIVEVVPGCEDGKRKPITNGDRMREQCREIQRALIDYYIDRPHLRDELYKACTAAFESLIELEEKLP
jgi:hypothetical protein